MVGTSCPYIEFLPKPGKARAVQIDIDPGPRVSTDDEFVQHGNKPLSYGFFANWDAFNDFGDNRRFRPENVGPYIRYRR